MNELRGAWSWRVEDIDGTRVVEVTCFRAACGHTAVVDVSRFKPFTRIVHIEHLFVCGKCGCRGVNSFQIVELPES